MVVQTQLEGERRWTAVLCADLVDFTGMAKDLGPERTYEIMRSIIEVTRSEIEALGGHIIEYAGDALFAVFGAPKAVENASLDACQAALKVQARMKAEEERYVKEFGVSPKFRIGLAGGSVVFGSLGQGERLDINVLGDAVNLSMRLQKETETGTVICSDAIYDQVEGFVGTTPLGSIPLKGYTGKHDIHLIERLLKNVSYFRGRMRRGDHGYFGRKGELATLKAWFLDRSSDARLIEISGPPGAGKSRLVHEVITQTEQGPDVLIGQCNLNIQQSTLAPIVEIMVKALEIGESETKATVEAKLAQVCDKDDPAFGYLVARLGGFDLPAGQNQSDLGIAIRRLCRNILNRLSATRDLVFLIEDAHWIDDISEAIMIGLLDESPSTACRFISTRRSYLPRLWTGRADIHPVELAPLSTQSVRDLVQVLAKTKEASPALVSLIEEKSENNPLFVEEIMRYLQFSDSLSIENDFADIRPDAHPNIASGNLQHLVLSRFDALPDPDREVLTIAAARGRLFSEEFLALCATSGTDIKGSIERAEDAGLIEEDPQRGENNWRFSHALIGDAIYESLLGPKRRDIHAIIASCLETRADNRTDRIADELAKHFQASGDNKKAVHYLWRSAEAAYEIFSVVLVDEQLKAAFELIDQEPDLVDDKTFGRMLFLWGRTLDIYGQFRQLTDLMLKYLPRLRKNGASEVLSLCLSMKALARCHAAEFKDAQRLLDEALSMANELDLEFPRIWAKSVQMRINVDSGFGSLSDTAALYEEVIPVAERLEDSHMIQLSTYVMMTAYRGNGSLRKANEYVDWLEEFGQKNNSTRAISMSHWARCINHLVRDDLDAAIDAANENLKLSVPNTADWRVAMVGRIAAKLNRGDSDVSTKDLLPHIDIVLQSDDTTLGNGARAQYWVNTLGAGQLYKGWKGLVRFQNDIQIHSTPEIRRFLELVRGEIHLSVAGIIPRSGSRPKMGPLDIATALYLKVNARKKAEHHLTNFMTLATAEKGYFVARVMRDFGLIAKSRGETSKARDYFAKSIALYEDEDMFETALTVKNMMDG